jgi:hypothetical protein
MKRYWNNQKRRLVLVVVALAIIVVAGMVIWPSPNREQVLMQERYNKVKLGSSITDAESVLQTQRGVYSYSSYNRPTVAAQDSVYPPRSGSDLRYYPGNRCGVLLYCDPETGEVVSKKLWIFETSSDPKTIMGLLARRLKSLI